jgi:AcrR family transcriptional regulator
MTEPVAERARKPHDPEARREALLAAATQLFAAHGFDGATVEQIAARAKVNKALISYHFGGKDGLYTTLLRSHFQRMAAALARLRAADLPADDALRALIALLGETLQRHDALPAMLLREILSGGRHIDDALMPDFLSVFEAVRATVERGVASGRFRPLDPALTHFGLVGALVFFFATATFRERKLAEGKLPFADEQPTAERFVAHMQEMMTRGLAAQPAEPTGGR